MYFLTHQSLAPLLDFIKDDSDVAEALSDTGSAPLRSRCKALPHTRFIHFNLFDKQPIDIDTLSIFRISHGGAQGFSDDPGGTLGNEFENVERFLNAFAANLVHHQPYFSRRDSDKFRDRSCFHNLNDLIYNRFARLVFLNANSPKVKF
jgi:hypothetical protein